MRSSTRLSAAYLAAIMFACAALGQQKPSHTLIDARSAIREISANDPESKIEVAEGALRDHLRAFCDRSAGEPPPQAAAEWLALVDEAISLPHRSFHGAMGGAMAGPAGTLYNVLITLPGPDVWPEIEKLVNQRPPSLDRTALLILCARLRGDDEAILKLCDEYDRQKPVDRDGRPAFSETRSVRIAALIRLGRGKEPQVIEQALEGASGGERSSVPRLTDVMPRATAEELLLKVAKVEKGSLRLDDSANRKLAMQVVVAHLADLPEANWDIAEDWSDLPYVKRLVEHYGFASLVDPNNQASTAQDIYFRDLVERGKLDEAVKLVKECQNPPRLEPNDWGSVQNADQFVISLQDRLPLKDLSDLYVSAAIASGHTAEAIKRLQKEIAASTTPHDRKLSVAGDLFDLHVREGDLRAVARDADLVHRLRKESDPGPTYQLLSMGLATGDKELINKGIALNLNEPYAPDGPMFTALADRGQFAQLEQLELRQLEGSDADSRTPERIAEALCQVYYRANRPHDILSLLRNFPGWPDKDLSELAIGNAYDFYNGNDSNQPTAFYAAGAFAKTGQADLAAQTLRRMLLRNPDSGSYYALLNEVGGVSSLEFYDEVIRAHPFAPTSVLWKGDLLFRLGKTAEAKSCVRRAAVIDPVGNSFYREKLLELQGQFFKKKGDAAGARKCAERVKAIQLDVSGAALEEAKLLPQARQAFERAVALWPDDAGLQNDLARCLELQCHPDEAKRHYLKAFEFSPASMGENSYFRSSYGRDFAAIGIERLNAVVKAHPRDPEAYYARAQLNQEADRDLAAIPDLEKVVALDPQHVGAWESLEGLGQMGLLSPEETQSVALKLINLNVEPEFGNSANIDLAGVRDLALAYRALVAKMQRLPTLETGPLFPLHSTAERRQPGIMPEFDYLDKRSRLIGWFFQQASDIREIASLYHPTGFPFE